MKKTLLMLLCSTMFYASCSNDEALEKEIEQLEQDLAAEKGKTVIDVRVEGEQMILVYSTGQTETIALSDALRGIDGKDGKDGLDGANGQDGADGQNGTDGQNGADGQDGVGIASITYNEETGILTITLTNGNATEFKLVDTGAGWEAALVGDTNGRLFLTEAMVGSVPVIKANYNENYQLTSLEHHVVADMEVAKAWNISRRYENNRLTGFVRNTYATTTKVAYDVEYFYGYYWEEAEFDKDKGYAFKEENGDGTFTAYLLNWENSGTYYYSVHRNSVIKQPNDYNGIDLNADGRSEIIRKVSDNVFEYYSLLRESIYIDNEEETWMTLNSRITITGQLEKGDIESTTVAAVETNADGLITKQFEATGETTEPNQYIHNEYNNLGKMTRSQAYYKAGDGSWQTKGEYVSYAYDADNNLISTTRHKADGTEEVIQRAAYDENGNPTEIWAYEDAVTEYRYEINPETGIYEYNPVVIREAGLHHVATIEYNYKFKNFLGNTVSTLLPELESYRIVNAIKDIRATNSYTFASLDYKEFDDYGYPRKVTFYGRADIDGNESAYYEMILNYLVKDIK